MNTSASNSKSTTLSRFFLRHFGISLKGNFSGSANVHRASAELRSTEFRGGEKTAKARRVEPRNQRKLRKTETESQLSMSIKTCEGGTKTMNIQSIVCCTYDVALCKRSQALCKANKLGIATSTSCREKSSTQVTQANT